MRPIRLLSLATLGVVVLALAGCFGYVISAQTAKQLDMIGDVQISTTICFDTGSSCSGSVTPPAQPTSVLVAYRLADGVTAPSTIASTSSPTVTFKQDQTYSDSLTANAAPPSGEHWVGYRADAAPFTDIVVEPHFGLPRGADGAPFHGPFKYRTVVGVLHDGSTDGTDPVVCGSDPMTAGPTNGNMTVALCIGSPDAGTWPTDEQLATRDLGITGGDATTAMQNASGQIPFSAQFAGAADSSATFQISVESNAPDGVTLTPSAPSLTPDTDSSTPITVNAQVAPTVPTGTYDVTLVAKMSNGQERRKTGKLAVALGKPVNLLLPDINGTEAVGKTVSCDNGAWSSSPTGFAYVWKRDGTAIAGATNQAYTLTEDDGARLVTCTVTATNEAASGEATSGPIRAAQEGGADVDLDGKPKVTKNSDGTYTIDTGITVTCPPRLPANCGGGNHIDAAVDATTSRRVDSAAVVLEVARGGFATKTGGKRKIVLHLNRRGSRLFKTRKKLTLTARVITRNHQLQRVVSKKRFTVTRPR